MLVDLFSESAIISTTQKRYFGKIRLHRHTACSALLGVAAGFLERVVVLDRGDVEVITDSRVVEVAGVLKATWEETSKILLASLVPSPLTTIALYQE